jgi:hypothetical protein
MNNKQALDKLLRAAARAERAQSPAAAAEVSCALETRVLAAFRPASQALLSLTVFRRAFAAAAAIALVSAGWVFKQLEAPSAYEQTVNYSIAAGYIQ